MASDHQTIDVFRANPLPLGLMNDIFVVSNQGDLDNLEQYRHLISAEEMTRLARAVQRPLPPAIRVNTLKIGAREARRLWQKWYGWQVQPVPFCAEGWRIVEHRHDLGQTVEHKMGFYYIQDAASMLPVEMFHFDTKAAPLILDMAAAPGGKTTHLACKLNDRGLIIANDTSVRRTAALRSILQDWGVMGTAISNHLGERFGTWFPQVFDKVLVDAPCSSESLRIAALRKSRPVSARERQLLQKRQIRLLTSALQAVKCGGEVVYATCTLAPEEDEAVLDSVLSLFPHQVSIEAVDHVLTNPAPGLASDGERYFHEQVRRAVRLWPHLYDTSGFFAALIRKHDAISVQPRSHPRRSLSDAGLEVLSREEKVEFADHLLESYGFDLRGVLEQQALTLWKRGKFVYAISEPYLLQFADFPCLAVGMLVGEQTNEEIVPSHELVARFSSQFTARRLLLSDQQIALWLAGRDLRGLNTQQHPLDGVILLEDDKHRFLGRGKVLSNRVRNLLPRRLVHAP
jgi:16S rRNA (cytosine1407-C5)-methyltransferase